MPPRIPTNIRQLPKTLSPTSRSIAALNLITTQPHRTLASSSHDHESMYEPPSGWLYGVPPGEKPKKEGWETISYIGIVGVLFAAGVAYAYKPDTSIQTWALEEARRRLEAEGFLEDSSKK